MRPLRTYAGASIKIGNTEVLARMIRTHIVADVYRIRATNPYPHDYEATVSRNVREQNEEARPRIANPLQSVDEADAQVRAWLRRVKLLR